MLVFTLWDLWFHKPVGNMHGLDGLQDSVAFKMLNIKVSLHVKYVLIQNENYLKDKNKRKTSKIFGYFYVCTTQEMSVFDFHSKFIIHLFYSYYFLMGLIEVTFKKLMLHAQMTCN